MIFKHRRIRFGIDGLFARGADGSRKRTRVLALLFGLSLAALLLGFGAREAITRADSGPASHGEYSPDARPQDTLIVWAGDEAHTHPDFLTVVDFDKDSPNYGRVLSTLPLKGGSAIGNEPHHVGLSADGNTLAVGGLLSILRGNDQVFFFNVKNRRDPKFISSDNPPGASIADEFGTLSHGGFLATFMGGPAGANPGRLVEYDAHQNFVKAWPADLPTDGGFDPHGLSIDEAHNLIVTSDFICPAHTLNPNGAADLRGSVRVWDLKTRSIVRTIVVGDPANPSGTINVRLIPGDPQLRAYTAGMADDKLYLIDTQHGTASPVFDFSPYAVSNFPIWPQLFKINRAGTRLFIALNYSGHAGKVIQFDISRPAYPKVLSVVDLGLGSGPHYIALTKDEKRLVVSDYFLVEDLIPSGVVDAEGDHKIHVFDVSPDKITLDPRFDLDFNRDIPTGRARPHGFELLPGGNDDPE